RGTARQAPTTPHPTKQAHPPPLADVPARLPTVAAALLPAVTAASLTAVRHSRRPPLPPPVAAPVVLSR
ncbi:serine/threonine protein kinase, partial [Streptomyces sp900105755]